MKLEPVDIGGRIEMFVDSFLIGEKRNVSLRLNKPVRGEIVLRMENKWEQSGAGIYSTVFKDGDKYRMYYRGFYNPDNDNKNDRVETQYACYAESADGINWERPDLGLVEFFGSKDNNIIMEGARCHNFSPWIDEKPGCPPDEKYKAVCGYAPQGLMAYKSADGLIWEKMQESPVITKGHFDSHNLWFYDVNTRNYRCYSRIFVGEKHNMIRAIQSCVSDDFLNWSEPVLHEYGDGVPLEHFYTNATVLCPGAEHVYLSFPMRFVPDRQKMAGYPHKGVSDSVFMTSRDGRHFDRTFREPWIAPDTDMRNWTQRNYITACGVLETGNGEFSLYTGEHYEWDDARIRRYIARKHGFGSVYADFTGGEFITRPVIFDGDGLYINYATSAAGFVKVGIMDEKGFGCEDCEVIYGNELSKKVVWNGGDLSAFSGKPVRLKFMLEDADLFAMSFRNM